jgi:hypothetical protein
MGGIGHVTSAQRVVRLIPGQQIDRVSPARRRIGPRDFPPQLEIDFYKDADWDDFRKLLSKFEKQ